eukprot:scaffold32360_cov18-Tisochrysis_lutea.AAC.3
MASPRGIHLLSRVSAVATPPLGGYTTHVMLLQDQLRSHAPHSSACHSHACVGSWPCSSSSSNCVCSPQDPSTSAPAALLKQAAAAVLASHRPFSESQKSWARSLTTSQSSFQEPKPSEKSKREHSFTHQHAFLRAHSGMRRVESDKHVHGLEPEDASDYGFVLLPDMQVYDSLEITPEKIDNAITDKIPERPVGVVEGTSYSLIIAAAFAVQLPATTHSVSMPFRFLVVAVIASAQPSLCNFIPFIEASVRSPARALLHPYASNPLVCPACDLLLSGLLLPVSQVSAREADRQQRYPKCHHLLLSSFCASSFTIPPCGAAYKMPPCAAL